MNITEHHPFFVQQLKVASNLKGLDRLEVFTLLCQGKRVLHVGCADAPITDIHHNLHLNLQKAAQTLDGFDPDGASLDLLRPYVSNGKLYSNLTDIHGEYDLVLVPEVIEHVENVQVFLEALDRLNFKELIITAPDAFSCMQRHFDYQQETGIFTEIVHPDHNAWYTPYTLYNILKKYTSWRVDGLFFLGSISIMAICMKV